MTATDSNAADILIENGTIAAVGSGSDWESDSHIDASGCFVMPGAVDVHTHLQHPIDTETLTADDFATGTVAAAFGGTTTIIDFVKRPPGQPDVGLYEAAQRRLQATADRAAIDYSFHAMVTSADDRDLTDLARLAELGITSFKVFMAYPDRLMVDDRVILRVMDQAHALGCMVLVHAENGHIVERATERLIAAGRVQEHLHMQAHPDAAEVEAVFRAIVLAQVTGCRLYIVHVSSRQTLEHIARARDLGLPVWGETCPHYLVKSYEEYEGLGFSSAKYICSPPIRGAENQAALWAALAGGTLSTVSSDHAPFWFGDVAPAPPNQKSRGKGYFPRVPSGVPGIEDRLYLLYERGVHGNVIGLSKFVDLVSTTPAKLFDLFPTKGSLSPGADADIVIWDPAMPHTLSAATHHMHVDYNLYEGTRVTGKPRYVLARGDVIVAGDAFQGEVGRGRFLRRPVRDGRTSVTAG